MSLEKNMIVQKIVNSLTNLSSFFFLEKWKRFQKKKLIHNIRQRVENCVVKWRNVCVEKGFNVQYSVIWVNLTL